MNEVYACEFRKAQATVDRCIKCPDKAAIAMTLIWLYWSRKPEIAIEQHIRFGIKHARAGRDLPGVQNSRFRDIWDHANNLGDQRWDSEEAQNTRRFGRTGKDSRSEDVFDVAANWGGGGMENLPDRSPSAERRVEMQELYALFLDGLTAIKERASELYAEGVKGIEIAKKLGVSSGRVSQMRSEMANDWAELVAD